MKFFFLMYKSQRLQVEVKQHISNVICFDLVPRGHDLHLQLSTVDLRVKNLLKHVRFVVSS